MNPIDKRPQSLETTGYAKAELLVAWTLTAKGKVRLLFCRVLLLPSEIPCPPTQLLVTPSSTKASQRCWAGIAAIPAEDALHWYETLLAGDWKVPSELGELAAPGKPAPPHEQVEGLLQEPEWPSVVVLASPPSTMPYVPADLTSPRVHHALQSTLSILEFSEKDRAELSNSLRPALHFDINSFQHLWGSAHLILPNPVLRSVDERLVPEDDGEGVGINLTPRRGASIEGLTVTLWERRGHGTNLLARFRAKSGDHFSLVRLTGRRQETALTIDSDLHGRIYEAPPRYFLRAVGLNLQLTGHRRQVILDRGKKGQSQYSINSMSPASTNVVGEPRHDSALSMLVQEDELWKARESARSREEVWFDGDWDSAQGALRELLQRAAETVTIVDYFFSSRDCGLVLPAIASTSPTIRILTSREGLKTVAHANGVGAKDEAQKLINQVEHIATTFRMQSAQVRFMAGAKAAIHDRFIAVDTKVYLLGSSLNEYGSRATMLVRLRNPGVVLAHIERHWNGARKIEEIN